MPKKKKKKKEKSAAKGREILIATLAEQFGLQDSRARAIVARYGPSPQRCMAAAATFVELERLIDPEL